jgi:hypothetical protein
VQQRLDQQRPVLKLFQKESVAVSRAVRCNVSDSYTGTAIVIRILNEGTDARGVMARLHYENALTISSGYWLGADSNSVSIDTDDTARLVVAFNQLYAIDQPTTVAFQDDRRAGAASPKHLVPRHVPVTVKSLRVVIVGENVAATTFEFDVHHTPGGAWEKVVAGRYE